MNKTTLNLVAISIFLMTFSILLGPLIHLSPAVPAVATFAILAIATFDSWSLEGRGGTLFLDLIGGFSGEYRERILHHEAGHFLVAYILGVPVTGYSLSAWEALKQKQQGLGGVTFDDVELLSQFEKGTITTRILERYYTIWMAGIAAEKLIYNDYKGGADDKNKIMGVLKSLGCSKSTCEQKQRFSILQAKTLLENNWSAYEALVDMMRERATVEECGKVLIKQGVKSEKLTANLS
ncbi:MAG: ATP-dependent Zn protease [Richelia sp. RM2_1_2]|nr:ATP-dependent Zn protease [Richelia sp. SM2_1_7]NJM22582.1 ATP-dependent Zn protease [Richelia sp. SM1_7_0]NJN12030.1 ATP-dependent Zn protease [Richelia sp. RM1_1_1]NJO30469.1 ATP-dependent Zn protease [Richelia sp. SL_2_1]NJO58200.1 ATP-dependent Zn protease [Richelia sp. RM2_1_2]